MSWTLSISSPTGVPLTAITDQTSPNPVMGGIEVVVDAGGITNQITLRVRQDLIQIPPRGILLYDSDFLPLAAGVVVTCPPLTSPGSGPADRDADALDRVTAVGLEQLLRDRVIGPRLFEGDMDVAKIAFNLCNLYGHPALYVHTSNFPNTGHSLGLYYSPEKSLWDALTQLADAVPGGARVWVDAFKAVHFAANP